MKPTWIKLELDLFDNKKIKKIRRMPDGDKLLNIWIYMLTEAGKCNAGGMIYICDRVPLDIEDIATELNMEINVVRLATETFKSLHMIGINKDNFIYIVDWEHHQNIEGLEKIREQNRIRQQRFREKQKLLPIINKEEDIREEGEENVTSNVTLKYLDFIYLKEEEYNKIFNRYGKYNTELYIEKLNNYIGSKGKRYKSHYYTLLSWLRKDNIQEIKEEKPDCLQGMQF